MTRATSRRRQVATVQQPSHAASAAVDAFALSLRPLVGEMVNEIFAKLAAEFLQQAGYVVTHSSQLTSSAVDEEIGDDDDPEEEPVPAPMARKRIIPRRIVADDVGNGHSANELSE